MLASIDFMSSFLVNSGVCAGHTHANRSEHQVFTDKKRGIGRFSCVGAVCAGGEATLHSYVSTET